MSLRSKWCYLVIVAALLGWQSLAALAEENVDRVTSLPVTEWHGKPIRFDANDTKTIYVFEYFARWPSVFGGSDDHYLLSAFKKFGSDRVKFVRIVDCSHDQLIEFLDKQHDLEFPSFALDNGDHQMLAALGSVGLPQIFPSFVITNGTGMVLATGQYQVEGAKDNQRWSGLLAALKAVTAPDFDPHRAARRCRAERMMREYRSGGKTEPGEKLLEYCDTDHPFFTRFATISVTGAETAPTGRRYKTDRPANTAFALKVAEKYAADKRSEPHYAMELLARALWTAGRKPEALEKAKAALAACKDEASKPRLEDMREHFENNQ